jgi:hypothetical protein
MHRFKGYIKEMAANLPVSKLDNDFIARATKVRSFNIKGADLSSLKNKAEIQFLYATYQFDGFDLEQTVKGMNVGKVNKLIDKLKSVDRNNFDALYDFQPKGVGPGEALLYFLIDDAVLGGGTSAGVDVKIGGSNFEVKGANLARDKKSVYGFKLGGTVDVSDMVNRAVKMKEMMGLTTAGKGKNEVNPTQIKAIRKKFPKEWSDIEKEYATKAHKYFGNTPVIFFNNNRGTGGKLTSAAGNVIIVKKVTKNDIQIDAITQGTIKPRVKI